MSSISSHGDNEYSHRQGSVISLLDEDDQVTVNSDSVIKQTSKELSSKARKLSSLSNEYSKSPDFDDTQAVHFDKEYQTATIDLQAVPDASHDDSIIQNWSQLLPGADQDYRTRAQSDSTDEITVSFGFHHQDPIENEQEPNEMEPEEINSTMDYETLVRARRLYEDPNPELIKKPQMIAPLVYKQNITIKFLKPPPVPLGPLIIREVRAPQPPPPPPLIIRQHPQPAPSPPPPIILREKPPRVPELMTTQFVTKTLPPLPPPPRSVVIERMAPLPPKPQDIIIERWIPYESIAQKRQVIVQRAEPSKPYPPSRNVIITYDPVPVKVVRQVERQGVTPENPQSYLTRFGNSLLDPKDLIAQARELGITEDISPPLLINRETQKKFTTVPYEQNSIDNHTTVNAVYNEIDHKKNASSYDNLSDDTLSSTHSYEWNEQPIDQGNNIEDLHTQLTQHGVTKESMPY
ncbi:unnamed protein product [Rotaria socialis]|uniref:Uncharacterized protein n=1 Tax=Rotaria socialis TaxID=392032 RepID=A0A818STH9_9BILA|nr:unnamed protein product [Rotaria socialis]CAF3411500.1 unnamed protein product [Rotaria socialis]CAF3417320.1 unnamed protein product [Rotaria socialis]CAF3441482.1 unnamed protein product [Rotaria socialis]CAF3670466.1 unnamed protein product [Rotaria socialis]